MRSGWHTLGCLVLLATAASGARADLPPPLALPTVEVNAQALPAKRERWRYASFGNFEVLSKPPDLASGGVLGGLQEFDYTLRLIFPALGTRPDRHVSLLLTHNAEYRDFAQAPSGTQEEFSQYFHGSSGAAIVVNIDATDATGENELIRFSTVDPSRQLNRQYLRFLFAEKGAKLPAWLEEGLAQTIADIEFRDSWVTYGKVVSAQNMPDGELPEPINVIYDYFTPNPALSGLSFKEAFSHRRFLPLDQLFSPPGGNARPSSDSAWAKQAYAFVHFCLFGNQRRYRAPLMAFIDGLNREPPGEELFIRCFAVNYATMSKELRGYLLHTRHEYQRYELKPAERFKAEPITFREAADDEIAVLKGRALQLARNDAAAQETYRQAYLRGVRAPDYLADYAEIFYRRGGQARARELLGLALKNGTRRPAAFVLEARLRFDQYSAAPADQDGKFNDTQLAAILEPLFAARQLRPALPEVYQLIAETWSRSESAPKPENLVILDEGIRLFPRESTLLIRSIEAYTRLGDSDKITSIARLGLRMAADAKAQAYFASFAGVPLPLEPKL